jgi:hypothetical protein
MIEIDSPTVQHHFERLKKSEQLRIEIKVVSDVLRIVYNKRADSTEPIDLYLQQLKRDLDDELGREDFEKRQREVELTNKFLRGK